MFLDVTDIYIKSGDGGSGKVSFYRAKHVTNGGPDGGDGARGGNIVFVADSNLMTLIDYKFAKHFHAENGGDGGKNNKKGARGADVRLKVPVGTLIKDRESGKVLADMFYDKQEVIIQYGGRGGRGNTSFASPTRQAPCFAQGGVKTEEKHITLELKMIADVGLIGFPNVGKSTLLSVLTAAKPKIANYHFTTLSPNIGILRAGGETIVVADIPGLIEGASQGLGLGHAFLRHIERVRFLTHLVDISGSEERDPIEDYYKIRKELEDYRKELANVPELIVGNKIDLTNDNENVKRLEEATGKKVYKISALTHNNIDELVAAMVELSKRLPAVKPEYSHTTAYEDDNDLDFAVEKEEHGVYKVSGGAVKMLARNVVFSDPTSMRYFQKKLVELGIIDELKKQGIEDGDTIKMLDIEFEYQQ